MIPLNRIRKAFEDEMEIGLFMTNDIFSFDSLCRDRPNIQGHIALTASYSANTESRYLHLYKIKEELIDNSFKDLFENIVFSEVKEWFLGIKNRKEIKNHNYLIYSIEGKCINSYEITYNP